LLAVLRGHLIINFKSYSNFGKLRGFKFENSPFKNVPWEEQRGGGSQRTPCCVEGVGEERLLAGHGHWAPPQKGGHSHKQNTVLYRMTEREVVKSDYVLDLDTELLIKRMAMAINRTWCCAG
jgi:hypothetical protein